LVRGLDVRVVRGNRLVVPVGDLLVEDLCQDGGAQVELGHTLQVERDGHWGDVDGDVHRAVAADLRGRGLLLLVESGVGTGELHRAGDELLTTSARADPVVVHGHVGLDVGVVAGDPGRHGGVLGGGASARQRAG